MSGKLLEVQLITRTALNPENLRPGARPGIPPSTLETANMNEKKQEPRPPGIYPGILNSVYQADTETISSTILKKMKVPFEAKYLMKNPQPYKEVFRMGSAIHKYLLEREDFDQEFLLAIDCDRRSKVDKEEWAQWFYAHGGDGIQITSNKAAEWNGLFEAETGKNIVTPEEIAAISMMSESVAANKNARRLLEGGEAESSVYWQDSETELNFRCRPDYLNAFCSDLKSCRSADPRLFGNSIHEMGYHISAAMYQSGLLEVTREIHPFLFIAIEKTPPYLCAVYKINDAGTQLGEDIFHHYARKMAQCIFDGKWPGLEDNLDLPLPSYAFNLDIDLYEYLSEG
jgi:hypothetical protein